MLLPSLVARCRKDVFDFMKGKFDIEAYFAKPLGKGEQPGLSAFADANGSSKACHNDEAHSGARRRIPKFAQELV